MPFFIAEISSNHNNSMDRIKKLSSLRKNLVSMQLNFKFLKSKNYFIKKF